MPTANSIWASTKTGYPGALVVRVVSVVDGFVRHEQQLHHLGGWLRLSDSSTRLGAWYRTFHPAHPRAWLER